MTKLKNSTLATILALTLVLSATTAFGVVRHHDVPDSLYVIEGKNYPMVCRVLPDGDGTLVAPQWVLTAAHVASHGMHKAKVQFGETVYEVEAAFIHPEWKEMNPFDIALLKLKKPVKGIEPVDMYRGKKESGKSVVFVGHGDSGTGHTGGIVTDRIRRAATNRVAAVQDGLVVIVFEEGDKATDLEGTPGPGDSGGPVFILGEDGPELAGVSYAGQPGEKGPGTYGAHDYSVRVSDYVDWLDAVIAGEEDVEAEVIKAPSK